MVSDKRLYALSSTVLFVSNLTNEDDLLEEGLDYLNDQVNAGSGDSLIEVMSLNDLPQDVVNTSDHDNIYGLESDESDDIRDWIESGAIRTINGKKYKLVPVDNG